MIVPQPTIAAGSHHLKSMTVASQGATPGNTAGTSCESRASCWFFRTGSAALCGMGLLVVTLTLLLTPGADLRTATRGGVPFGPWVLQVLITGNLAVGLLWVWLDWQAWRRGVVMSLARGNLCTAALLVAGGITFFCLALGGQHSCNDVLGMALCLAFPSLAVLLPLLWLTVRRLESVRLGTLILVGFIAASALVQGRVGDSPATDGENLFVMNSCLIGVAVAVWLLSWANSPEPSKTP